MDTKNVSQIVKVVKLESGGFASWFSRAKHDPNRAWQVIFGIFLLAALLLLAFSGYLFIKISKGEIFTVSKPETEQIGTIDREKLGRILSALDRKALKLSEIKAGGTVYVDPSI